MIALGDVDSVAGRGGGTACECSADDGGGDGAPYSGGGAAQTGDRDTDRDTDDDLGRELKRVFLGRGRDGFARSGDVAADGFGAILDLVSGRVE